MAAISVAAEPIGLGPHVTNALLTSFVLSAALVIFSFVLGRRLQERPGGLQNVVESVIEGLDNLVKDAAPARWAERFFPIVATIFLYLIVVNMFSLLTPFLGAIGPAHSTSEGGIAPDAERFGIPRVVLIGGDFEDLEPLHGGTHDAAAVGGHHADHVLIVPFLRAPSSDLNMTLALALITVILTQWFGLRSHGARYLSTFLPLGGLRRKGFVTWAIELFVGVLEGISELARIGSFSFPAVRQCVRGRAETFRYLAAALAIGVGALGPGIAIGITALGAMQSLGRNPEAHGIIRTNMLVAMAFAESVAIYALVITLIILFVV
ncbi:ATP synthase subunit c [Geodia barretti]|uniref:ATP synthase F0 sector subunit C n=1 Tax=Geodia barretti TaxID=519541 RepID=A0AA35TB77_GEOBA|nr:ATP synthase subunit c [Geodia barretti]